MKKLLLILAIMGFGVVGTMYASAQYYYDSNYYYDTSSYTTSYTSYQPTHGYGSSWYGGNYGNYTYGIGSYTIGCTTYFYNTRTGATLYTQNICNQYTGTYPSYPQTPSQYCTYKYVNGAWYPSCGGNQYGGGYYGGGYNNYLNCYYDQWGQYVCW